jgi:hypothetical protein
MDGMLSKFIGCGEEDYLQLQIHYHEEKPANSITAVVSSSAWSPVYEPVARELGQYNRGGERIGTWKHYDRNGVLYETVSYIVPRKEDDLKGEAGENKLLLGDGTN